MINSEPRVIKFADGEALSQSLANEIAAALESGIELRGAASLVVSGGKSPTRLFELLRQRPLDWSRVAVALADERWVESTDPASNEKLVRESLLQGSAASARFIGLKNGAPTPEMGAVSAWETFARVPRPFDTVHLGMGDDGHTASLFPSSPNLSSAMDPAATPGCAGMRALASPRPRLSLNLSALLDARRIVILITGQQKWQTFLAALAPGPVERMPIRAVLRQTRTPVEVFWSP